MKNKNKIFWAAIILIACIATVAGAGSDKIKVFINDQLLNIANTANTTNQGNNNVSVRWDETTSSLHLNLNDDELLSNLLKKVNKSVVIIVGKYSEYESSKYGLDMVHGSGVIISNDGLIVTNAHVVKDMKKPNVILNDGTTLDGVVKFMDEEADLALVKINKGGLEPAKLAVDNKIQVGQNVLAIGTPLDFSLYNTVSKGVISGTNRSLGGNYKFIQTDAPINPGNSGGPLINLKGEIIGINSMGAIYYDGLGFTIPSQTVQYIIDQYNKYGKVVMPNTGLSLEECWQAKYGFPSKEGLKVTKIDKNSYAQKSGIKVKDEITAIDDNPIYSLPDYYQELRKHDPGDVIKVQLKRQGGVINVDLTLSLR